MIRKKPASDLIRVKSARTENLLRKIKKWSSPGVGGGPNFAAQKENGHPRGRGVAGGTWIAGLCPWFSATHVARIAEGTMMAFFQKVPNLIPIDPDNVVSNDWIILLEANTIVNFSGELRVARTTQERKIVKRFRSFRRRPFLVMDGYDPRIHTLYFCPQLYKHDEHGRLVPLEGEEIGRLLAKALEGKVKLRLPWYEPTYKLPADPIIAGDLNKEFDTLVIDEAPDRPRLVASTGSEGAAG